MNRAFSIQALWWTLLLAFSLPAGWLLQRSGFPAAFLIAPMLCAIVFSSLGAGLSLPRYLFNCSQSLIGYGVANSITAGILATIGSNWLIMLLIVGSTILAGGLVGWLLMRWHTLPGTTAAWGSTPGAAAAMVAMAEAHGADARLVALMQYLRVLVVVLSASTVAHFLIDSGTAALASPPVISNTQLIGSWQAFLNGLGVAAAGGFIGLRLRIPAGAMLVPMILGAVLQAGGFADIQQPFWLQAIASLLLGWFVGLGFNRGFLISAFRMLPRLLLSTVLLIGLCAISAGLLIMILHIDPLTAYLSTSPGGLDTLILIAMSSEADVPFVVAVQTLRFFMVVLTGSTIARLICRYS